MAKPQSLLGEAQQGFLLGKEANPHLHSSACWFAHEAGAFLERTGRAMPSFCTMGRGYKVNINDMVIGFDKSFAPYRLS